MIPGISRKQAAEIARAGKTRSCLMCSHGFHSQGAGHRICDDCKGTQAVHDWRLPQPPTALGAFSGSSRILPFHAIDGDAAAVSTSVLTADTTTARHAVPISFLLKLPDSAMLTHEPSPRLWLVGQYDADDIVGLFWRRYLLFEAFQTRP
jgi:hypothetical protein